MKLFRNTATRPTVSSLAAAAAERQRAETLARETEEARQLEAAPREEAQQRALMLQSAFEPIWYFRFQIVLFLALGVGFVGVCIHFFNEVGDGWAILLILASFVAGGVLATLLTWPVQRLLQWRGLRWLARLPRPWQPAGYLDILRRQYYLLHLTATVGFESRIPEERQEAISAAVGVLLEDSHPRWTDNQTLEVWSPRLSAYKYHHGRVSCYEPYNRCIHLWFRRFAKRVLPLLQQEHPVARLGLSTTNFEPREIHQNMFWEQ